MSDEPPTEFPVDVDLPDGEIEPDTLAETAERMDEFSRRCLEAIELHEEEGISVKEAAERTGVFDALDRREQG